MKKLAARNCRVILIYIFLIFTACSFINCSFDYGAPASSGSELPDLVMINVEYIRVKSSDPIAKFNAERAERYEKQGVMKLENLSFEQYGGEDGTEVNVTGQMGYASVTIQSGDIFMDNGVILEVESEDVVIDTAQLEWKDETRILSSNEENIVNISRQNGTNFSGTGIVMNSRKRSWEFLGAAGGTYIHVDDDADESAEME